MSNKKSSWEYQKNRYKQLNIKFNMDNNDDSMIYYYLTCKTDNATRLIKNLLLDQIWKDAYNEQ